MRYCPQCDTEYRDDVTVCSEDGTTLLDKSTYEALRTKPKPISVGRLTAVLALDDRFEAEELAQGLLEEGLDVGLLPTKASMLGPVTNPGPETWALVVPEAEADRARQLLTEWRSGLEASGAAAAALAEQEEAAGEKASSPV